jgi:hypothetical protein
MSYQVIETQEHTEPLDEWAVLATFETEKLALEFMDIHYQTQIGEFSEDKEGERTQCVCESCVEGWRPIDRMALVLQVREVK